MKLDKQCEKLCIELQDITLEYSGKPEPAVLKYFESEGYIGSYIEGAMILNILKALMLSKLSQYNYFEDRSDACARYLVAQFTILKDKTDELVASIRQTTKKEFLHNFQEITEHPFIKSTYPSLSITVAEALFDAIDTEVFVRLASKFSENLDAYGKGWPDLTIVKGEDVRFVEVKTTDQLHASQLKTIPTMNELIPFPFIVVRVSKKSI
ncbi:VRR-NUC domain-containing protein [Moritella sp.]|uniref:VRR-NUC domain-containing protein n=1 Tax=Moritella sp. TaxID=78556 RepID=UPI0025ED6AC2|nr:VRR-NUC domain-containing protein [Moritella sp.]MCJ8352014.1 VRR-NUC domain-containing protein [Moritella sp.]